MLPFELTKDTLYLALSGELWSVFYEYFTEIDRVIKGFYCTIPRSPLCIHPRAVKLPWICPGAPLTVNGAPGNIQGNLKALPPLTGNHFQYNLPAAVKAVGLQHLRVAALLHVHCLPFIVGWLPSAQLQLTNSLAAGMKIINTEAMTKHFCVEWGVLY